MSGEAHVPSAGVFKVDTLWPFETVKMTFLSSEPTASESPSRSPGSKRADGAPRCEQEQQKTRRSSVSQSNTGEDGASGAELMSRTLKTNRAAAPVGLFQQEVERQEV